MKSEDTSAETFHAMDSRRFALLNYWPIGGRRFWICEESLLDLCFLLLFRTKRLSGLSQRLREPYIFINFVGIRTKSFRRCRHDATGARRKSAILSHFRPSALQVQSESRTTENRGTRE